MPPGSQTVEQTWRLRLDEARRRVLQVGDEEAVHALRVALARVRVWLWLAGERALERDVRALRRRAAKLRDLDVIHSLRPPRPVALALSASRPSLLVALRAELTRPKRVALLRSFAAVPPVERAAAEARLRRCVARLLGRGDAAKTQQGKREALHALRRSARRLRFGLELLGAPPAIAKQLQSALGAVCDLDLYLEHAALAPATVARVQRRRATAAREALATYASLRPTLARLSAPGSSLVGRVERPHQP